MSGEQLRRLNEFENENEGLPRGLRPDIDNEILAEPAQGNC